LAERFGEASYSYGDSTGLTPDFPFNPGYQVGNQIAANVGREAIQSVRVFNSGWTQVENGGLGKDFSLRLNYPFSLALLVLLMIWK